MQLTQLQGTANQREVGQSSRVELSCVGVAKDTSPTQLNSTELNSTLSSVELRRYKRALKDDSNSSVNMHWSRQRLSLKIVDWVIGQTKKTRQFLNRRTTSPDSSVHAGDL